MARSIGPGGMMDVRSLAILEDLTLAEKDIKDCLSERKRNRYYGSKFFEDLPEDAEAKSSAFFDRPKDWLHCACALFICIAVFGILHALPVVLPIVKYTYNMGALERTVVSAATYAVAFSFGPLASRFVKWMGHRLTCIFGLLLLFVGLVVDALEIHVIAFYVAHLVLIGFGSCFAITGAASSVLRHFRTRLRLALTLITISAPIGTFLFHYIFYVLAVMTNMSYKWVILTISILVLACIGLTHALPKYPRAPRHPNPFHDMGVSKKEKVKNCLANASHAGGGGDRVDCCPPTDLDEPGRKSCFCVCVLDLSAVTDFAFLLWVIVSSCATVTIYAPYLFILWYVDVTYKFHIGDSLYLILWLCVGSTVGRAFVMLVKNNSFLFSRTLFQAGLAGSAFLYSVLSVTTTFGWFVVWFLLGGLCEGLIVGATPRLTLQTIPRKYMAYCWGYTVFCNGVATIIGPYLLMVARQLYGDIALASVSIGILQFCAVFLSFFLPNEESYDDFDEEPIPRRKF